MTTAKQIRERAEAAQAAYEKGEAELYRPDGQKRYSDAEHAERLKELGAERRRACGEAAAAARTEADTMRQGVAALENRDTSALLSVEELVAAGARKPFVDEELSALTSEAVAARLDSVGGGNDRPGMYCTFRPQRGWRRSGAEKGTATWTFESPRSASKKPSSEIQQEGSSTRPEAAFKRWRMLLFSPRASGPGPGVRPAPT